MQISFKFGGASLFGSLFVISFVMQEIENGLKIPVYRFPYSKVQSYAGLECVC